jgi:4-amino-4-deoxy-L-arabinose transferase-like glycosyltransferase
VRFRAALVFLTLAGFALRIYGLGRQSFWLDEVDAISMAGEPVLTHLRKLTAIGENGPLYFLLFKGWVALAGTSEFGARYLSALCSTAAVPLLAVLVYRLLGDAPTALCAALLAAVSPYYVWYGQDAKMYPLFALLALAAQYCFLRGWRLGDRHGDASWPWWLGYAAASTLALYVHLFAALQIAANTVAGLFLWRWQPAGRRGFAWATAALVAPYVPLALWQAPLLRDGASVGYQPASLQVVVVALLEQMTWHLRIPADRRTLLAVSLVALWGLWRIVREPGHGSRHETVASEQCAQAGRVLPAAVLLAWLVVPVALVLAVQGRVPVFRDRYLIPLLAPFLVLLARAVAPPWRADAAAAAASAVFLTAGFGYGLAHRPPNPDYRAAAELVRSMATPEDQVGFLAGYAERPFEFYFRQGKGRYVKVTLPYTNYPDMDERAGLLAVASSLRGGRWLWIVRFEDWLWDSRNLTGEYLANRGAKIVLQRDFDGVSVTRYEMPAA